MSPKLTAVNSIPSFPAKSRSRGLGHDQRSASATFSAEASDVAKPLDDHRPRARLCRRRHAEGRLPRLSRRARQGGRRPDDDGRLRHGVARQRAGLQQYPRLQGRSGRLDEGPRRRLPRARRGGDDPIDAPRPPHPLGPGRLAARRLAFASSRGGASRLSQEARGLGHRAHRRRLRRRRRAHEGGRARRRRTRGLRPFDGPVLVAADQYARRPLWRRARQPLALRLRSARRHPPARRRRIHRRRALERRRGGGRRPDPGGRLGDFATPGGLGNGGLPQCRARAYRHRRRPDRRHPGAGHGQRAAFGFRRRAACGDGNADVSRRADSRRRDGASRHRLRQTGYGRHDARAHRRSAYRAQDRRRPRGRNPPLRRRQLLPRPHLPGRRGLLPAQRRHRTRIDDAARDPARRRAAQNS